MLSQLAYWIPLAVGVGGAIGLPALTGWLQARSLERATRAAAERSEAAVRRIEAETRRPFGGVR